MGHHIMPHLFFSRCGTGEVDICDMILEFFDLFFRDGKTQLMLCPGKGDPKLPPGFHPFLRREKLQHIGRCIPGSQRCFITVVHSQTFLIAE